ncbi:hypothetical protein GO001_23805 [Streptomyces sp. NRRL B-1677]|uniref:Uncharacterized protein n=1 Tax=Streptomyces eurocidicus TaxID=66423 RepID=A0A2N8NWP2_STREU|nr:MULTISPECIES: hypothetical protein [Streptomyces]MBB5118016.1 hypothetical protein [Streptomyces eurocidicus]MBF6048204.1 hypothetical protein [Streptomyces sp. NRRL B-1677]MBF6053991.1 hypothetical protein [Streptomyces eurocidicus]PNE33195.1 hypothetical protein AF335_09650 [Streptomyces eurocidicus]
MSDAMPNSETPNSEIPSSMPAAVDLDAIRAEVIREYADELTRAEFKVQAAEAGAKIPDGFMDYLDTSKLLGEDGLPSAEAIARVVEPFTPKAPKLPQLMGAGYHRGGSWPAAPVKSLDIRNR